MVDEWRIITRLKRREGANRSTMPWFFVKKQGDEREKERVGTRTLKNSVEAVPRTDPKSGEADSGTEALPQNSLAASPFEQGIGYILLLIR